MVTRLVKDRLGRDVLPVRHRGPMVRHILASGLVVMALFSAVMVFGTSVANTRDRGGLASGGSARKACAAADRELSATASAIDQASDSGIPVAALLGAEFGMTEEAITLERSGLGASWGNLAIAHTLAASDERNMTVAQVLQLHDRGMKWGQVAAGLQFRLDDAVKAVNAESRVARGLVKADGKLAPILLLLSDGR
jgi:hypothetical protein